LRRSFATYVACMGETDAGDLIVAGGLGWLVFRNRFDSHELVGAVPFDAAAVRFNDGKIGPDGAFWAGTMDLNAREPIGALYRLTAGDRDGEAGTGSKVRTVEEQMTISNGIGWSPDTRIMYLTDSNDTAIYSYDFDAATGTIENRRVFVRDTERPGAPDGLSVDSEGNVWSARWGGGAVICYDPRGKERDVINLPALNTSSCCFGGESLDVLYITTARFGLENPEELDGALFACSCGKKGQKPYVFGEN